MARIECIGDNFWMAHGDISNAFDAVELEDGLSDYFTLRPLPASSIGLTSLDGEALAPSDILVPCLRVLPMGWSWAMHLCQ